MGLSQRKWDELCCVACASAVSMSGLQIYNAGQCRHSAFSQPRAHNGSVSEVLILILIISFKINYNVYGDSVTATAMQFAGLSDFSRSLFYFPFIILLLEWT